MTQTAAKRKSPPAPKAKAPAAKAPPPAPDAAPPAGQDQASRTRSVSGKGLSPEARRRLVDKLTPDQRELFDRLASFNDRARANELESCWQLGRHVYEADEDTKTYGKSFVRNAAALLGVSVSYLYNRLTFYRRFPDESSFGRLTAFCADEGRAITYSHVEKLQGLKDDAFWSYLRQAAHGAWSVGQLGQVVRTNAGQSGRRNDPRGRRVAVPAGVPAQIDDLHQALSPLRKRAEVWAHPERGLKAAVAATPPERLEASWLDHLTSADTDLEETTELLRRVREEWAAAKEMIAQALASAQPTQPATPAGDGAAPAARRPASWSDSPELDIFRLPPAAEPARGGS